MRQTVISCEDPVPYVAVAALPQLASRACLLLAAGLLVAVAASGQPAAEEKTLLVGPTLADCTGVAPMKCLQVRDDAASPWRLHYGGIEGFTHEAGFEYELRVRIERLPRPPADAPSLRYTLLEVVRKTAVATAAAGSLEGPTWRLASATGLPAAMLAKVERPPFIRFKGGAISGNAGCNNLIGTYEGVAPALTVKLGAMTRMSCGPEADRVEQFVANALLSAERYAVEQGRLVMTCGDAGTMTFDGAQEPGLEGPAWSVTGYNNGRQAVVSLQEGTSVVVQFANGTVSGSAGCNTFRGQYTRDGERLTIGNTVTTRKMCPGEGVMAQEQAFLAALRMAATWSVADGRLQLRTGSGALVLSATAKK